MITEITYLGFCLLENPITLQTIISKNKLLQNRANFEFSKILVNNNKITRVHSLLYIIIHIRIIYDQFSFFCSCIKNDRSPTFWKRKYNIHLKTLQCLIIIPFLINKNLMSGNHVFCHVCCLKFTNLRIFSPLNNACNYNANFRV